MTPQELEETREIERKRKKMNRDLEIKPKDVSDADWEAFKQKRESERRQIERDEAGGRPRP